MSADTQNTESGMSSGTRAEVRELERQLDEARAQVKAAEERAQENLDRWQRAQADLVNYRRRTQFDREQELKFAGLPLITEMLRIFDGFDRAWKSLPVALRNLSWIEGIWMLDQQFQEIVRRTGLTRIDQVDQPFDPGSTMLSQPNPAKATRTSLRSSRPGTSCTTVSYVRHS